MIDEHSQEKKMNGNDANTLLDAVIERLNLKNDAALSRAIEVAPPVISKLRHGKLTVSALLLIRLHDATGLPVNDLRALAGLPIPQAFKLAA
jgi:plasmid maintenance system antidote protein VapI